jgi:hypothetical protein
VAAIQGTCSRSTDNNINTTTSHNRLLPQDISNADELNEKKLIRTPKSEGWKKLDAGITKNPAGAYGPKADQGLLDRHLDCAARLDG